jgi:mono/diheme cytochrome c family protein
MKSGISSVGASFDKAQPLTPALSLWERRGNAAREENNGLNSKPGQRQIMNTNKQRLWYAVLAASTLSGSCGAAAQVSDGSFGNPSRFMQQDGEVIYRTVCQGCHMPDGQGAVGAGSYPALANNERLASAGYAVSVVANGLRAMPAFASKLAPSGCLLGDAQIAAAVNYVRTHFDNRYTDIVSAEDVKSGC